ncbi:sigma-54-dependent transcriptional regulator, partial [Flavobacterium sp.]
ENILIVDDNYDMLELLQRNLRSLNFHTYKAASVAEAMNVLQYSAVDLLITDLQMPGGNGLELLEYVNGHFPDMPSLVITGFPTVKTALKATKLGARDYLSKPFTAEEFKNAVFSILRNDSPVENKKKGAAAKTANTYGGMVGASPQYTALIDVIERVKDNKATVLINGESGTGKELIAQAIHTKGVFASKPFVAINCGAIPENLIESELFGHVKGAFSGAVENKKGLFEAAEGGTVFLDEIGTLPMPVQTRLLRVLQEKEVRMLGSTRSQKITARIIAATNADLMQMVREKQFREDLYYRLNVVTIETTPVRDRPADIPLLINTFLAKYGKEYGKPAITIADDALKALLGYNWPGNVRELENITQRLIIMADAEIQIDHIPAFITNPEQQHLYNADSLLLSLQEAEKAHILKVLAAVGNNKTRAAEILQIDRKTLRAKLG